MSNSTVSLNIGLAKSVAAATLAQLKLAARARLSTVLTDIIAKDVSRHAPPSMFKHYDEEELIAIAESKLVYTKSQLFSTGEFSDIPEILWHPFVQSAIMDYLALDDSAIAKLSRIYVVNADQQVFLSLEDYYSLNFAAVF